MFDPIESEHPKWCVTQPTCALGHAGAELIVMPDPDSPVTVAIRLWQAQSSAARPTLIELQSTTYRGTQHISALSLAQAGELDGHIATLVKLARE